MKSYVILENTNKREFPSHLAEYDDVRMPDSLVEYFLNHYTNPGDSVIDIFAGFGTTLFVAEEMKRIPYGIEYEKAKSDFIKENLLEIHQKNMIHGDCIKISSYNLPQIDFLITSPPYMGQEDDEAPLTAYNEPGNYLDYLDGIRNLFEILKGIIKPNGFLVVEVANLVKRETNVITTLAWDIGKKISEVLQFKGEIIIGWKKKEIPSGEDGTYGYGYDHSYCLVFQNG